MEALAAAAAAAALGGHGRGGNRGGGCVGMYVHIWWVMLWMYA